MLIVDAHQDLAYNMLTHGRDYTRSALETRRLEAGASQSRVKEDTLLGWPEFQRGRVGVIFATLFATPARLAAGDWDQLRYTDANQAQRLYREQLDLYHRLVDDQPDKFQLIRTGGDLRSVLAGWQRLEDSQADQQTAPVGLVVLMEGAEGVRAPAELEEWWAGGVRLVGLAWAGNRYCGGTREPGRLTPDGFELLEHMAGIGFGLDASHMDEAAVLQAVDFYAGTIVATHSNARALLKGDASNRHLSDRVIQALLERDAVIGILPFNGFLQAGWKPGDRRELVTMQHIIAQIDYICQLAGDARHVGLGSDFDGGFGRQSVPVEIDSIADLQKLTPLLGERGYSEPDIAAIFGGNWLRKLQQIIPERL